MTKERALKLLPYDFSQLLSYHDLGSCGELVVNRYGDVVTFRVYENGEVTSE